MRNDARGSDVDGRPNSERVDSPAATHWTRILYCDLYTGRSIDSATEPGERTAQDRVSPAADSRTVRGHEENKEVSMKTTDSKRYEGPDRRQSSIQGYAILLAICILAYLVMAAILHVASVEAAAAPLESRTAQVNAGSERTTITTTDGLGVRLVAA
jgi:hypothetical protein